MSHVARRSRSTTHVNLALSPLNDLSEQIMICARPLFCEVALCYTHLVQCGIAAGGVARRDHTPPRPRTAPRRPPPPPPPPHPGGPHPAQGAATPAASHADKDNCRTYRDHDVNGITVATSLITLRTVTFSARRTLKHDKHQ